MWIRIILLRLCYYEYTGEMCGLITNVTSGNIVNMLHSLLDSKGNFTNMDAHTIKELERIRRR